MASDLTLFQRLMNVAAHHNSLNQQDANNALTKDLYQQYREALTKYLSLCIPPQPFCPLNEPFSYFYRDASNNIYTVIRYPYGQYQTSNRLTYRGFPYLLRDIFRDLYYVTSFPTTGPVVDNLYQKLTELILKYPYDRLDILLNELKRYSPQIAYELSNAKSFRYSLEGNLLINKLVCMIQYWAINQK